MTESGDSSRLRPNSNPTTHQPHRRRRFLPLCLLLVVLLAVIILILALTVFKPKDPTTQLVSVRVRGVSPSVSYPVLRVELNITLDLQLLIYNPNVASFAHAPGSSLLFYRGAQVGEAEIASGNIPARGSEVVACALTVQADRLAAQAGNFVGDVIAGEVGFDTSSRVPGRVTFLGFIKHHAVAISECHVVVGFPDLKVRRQDCTQKTQL